jgi:hypothetical protein
VDLAAQRRKRRASWKVNVFRTFAEADAYDVEYWLSVPIEERAALTWELSRELHQIAHPDQVHEPRLRRSAVRITGR